MQSLRLLEDWVNVSLFTLLCLIRVSVRIRFPQIIFQEIVCCVDCKGILVFPFPVDKNVRKDNNFKLSHLICPLDEKIDIV